ncbi:MAG: ATP-dependent zinc metalloprotease FtsH [Candidatus Paceibacterota bacterium]
MDIFKKSKKSKKKGVKKVSSSKKNNFWGNLLSTLIIFLVLVTGYSLIVENTKKPEEISLTTLAADIMHERVSHIIVSGEKLKVSYKIEEVVEVEEEEEHIAADISEGEDVPLQEEEEPKAVVKEARKEAEESLTQTLATFGITSEDLATIDITIEKPSGLTFFLLNIAPFLIPILFIVILFWFIARQAKGAGMQAFTFGQSKARITHPDDKVGRVTLKDIAGVKEAKHEVEEFVDFLRNPKKFIEIGARIPKGMLLMGAPGTGKTLMARAIAGEARVPFFSISGSEFVEMFVGVGASRVRDLFKEAKKAAPAIIFVDEIDAVGRVRGTGVGGGNDEREQTLNQILVEMDGFEQNEKVIVIAATNRPDVLDPALLRPGRFDRRVILDLPDLKDREEILGIHARKKPLGEDVNFQIIAERTPGFSGADLSSLVNEAAILAARDERKKITQFDLIQSIEKVMLGPERRSHLLSSEEKKITAYHEAGHALVASLLPFSDPVHKISIISRGHAGGYTLKLPYEERRFQSKRSFLDDIAVSLGGFVAEDMLFDNITTGPSNDLSVASALARDMVTKYGMSDSLGPIVYEEQGGRYFDGGAGVRTGKYSQEVSAKIDAEVSRIINELLVKVRRLLSDNKKVLDAIAEELVAVETIEHAEFEKLLIAHGITPKKRKEKGE